MINCYYQYCDIFDSIWLNTIPKLSEENKHSSLATRRARNFLQVCCWWCCWYRLLVMIQEQSPFIPWFLFQWIFSLSYTKDFSFLLKNLDAGVKVHFIFCSQSLFCNSSCFSPTFSCPLFSFLTLHILPTITSSIMASVALSLRNVFSFECTSVSARWRAPYAVWENHIHYCSVDAHANFVCTLPFTVLC